MDPRSSYSFACWIRQNGKSEGIWGRGRFGGEEVKNFFEGVVFGCENPSDDQLLNVKRKTVRNA